MEKPGADSKDAVAECGDSDHDLRGDLWIGLLAGKAFLCSPVVSPVPGSGRSGRDPRSSTVSPLVKRLPRRLARSARRACDSGALGGEGEPRVGCGGHQVEGTPAAGGLAPVASVTEHGGSWGGCRGLRVRGACRAACPVSNA